MSAWRCTDHHMKACDSKGVALPQSHCPVRVLPCILFTGAAGSEAIASSCYLQHQRTDAFCGLCRNCHMHEISSNVSTRSHDRSDAVLADATDILITGDSAGGVAALNSAGPLRTMLQPQLPR